MASAPVFLWLFALPEERLGAAAESAQRCLPAVEWDELRAIADPGIRLRRLLRRALARCVLGTMLGVLPSALPIVRTPRGKPLLPVPLAFSIASRGDAVAIACSEDSVVGVDLEAQDLPLAAEIEHLLDRWMAPPLRARFGRGTFAPFQAWTAIEAIRKASGEGIGDGDFTLGPSSRLPEVIHEQTASKVRLWRMHRFVTARPGTPAGPLAGALAWPHVPEAVSRQVALRRLNEEQTTICLMDQAVGAGNEGGR